MAWLKRREPPEGGSPIVTSRELWSLLCTVCLATKWLDSSGVEGIYQVSLQLSQSAAKTVLSAARMTAFREFFKAADDQQCLGAMLWHHDVSAALWPLVGWVELALRNRTHYALSMLHGGLPSRAWYGGGPQDMRLRLRLRRRIDDMLGARSEAGDKFINGVDDFVAETTFGLWLEVLYELAPDRRFRYCRLAMPGHEALNDKAAWAVPGRTWVPVLRRLERHKTFRDRIAHHAPLWKVAFERQPGGASMLPSGPGALIQALRREASAMRRTLEEMDPGLTGVWSSARGATFCRLTTMAALGAYMGRSPGRSPVPVDRVAPPCIV